MKRAILLFLFIPFFCFSQKAVTLEYPAQLDNDTLVRQTKIIDNIFLQEKFSLLIGSNGCFHSVSVEYAFIKKVNYFEVAYVKRYNPKDKTIKCKGTVKLSNEKMEQIHKLCTHGLNIPIGGCTTSVAFELSDKTQRVSFSDDRCAHEDDIMNRIGEIVCVCKDL